MNPSELLREVEHRDDQGQVVVHGLLVEVLVRDDERVDLLDADATEWQGAERRAQMSADDAHVVDATALLDGLLIEPVVAEVGEGLLDRRDPHALTDLVDFDEPPAQLFLGDLVVVVDGALAHVVLVEPADAPFAAHTDGLGHGLLSVARARPTLIFTIPTEREDRRDLARKTQVCRAKPRSRGLWPQTGLGMKKRGSGVCRIPASFQLVARARNSTFLSSKFKDFRKYGCRSKG